MGEREEGSTGLRSMMGDEEVGLVNEVEERRMISTKRRPVNGGKGMCKGVARR
jgi:hypothetical protein